MNLQTKLLINAALIVVTLIAGFFLHKAGRPWPVLWLNLHKFAMLGFVVWFTMITVRFLKHNPPGILLITALALAGISVLVLMVSGGLLSAGRLHEPMLLTHRLATLVFILTTAGVFYRVYTG